MRKSRLLLLDANVVILLFKLGIWDAVVDRCEVYLSKTVAETEADYFETADGGQRPIDLAPYTASGRIVVFDVVPSEVNVFRASFDVEYFDRLDPGEAESLVYVLKSDEPCQICSADKIVYRVLGNLCQSDAGISLEEILARAGLGRSLPPEYGKAYREKWSGRGFSEGMWGRGLKDSDARG